MKATRRPNVVIEKRNLSWGDVAALYEQATGLKIKNLRNGELLRWAMGQKERFYVDEEGTMHLLVQP